MSKSPGNQQQLDIDSEDKEETSRAVVHINDENALVEKIAAFFEDRPSFYDVQNEHYKNRSRREFAASIGMDCK